MLVHEAAEAVRTIESADDLAEFRLGAVGFIFHGTIPDPAAKRAPKGSNTLHFARCAKVEKADDNETKIWFRSVRVAVKHLDEHVGNQRWKWCKACEKEITQKILNEA